MKAIIMAGGSGTRLWPLSRAGNPKQFLKLKGWERSLYQMTVERAMRLCAPQDIFVLTVAGYEGQARGQALECSCDLNIIAEPEPKNTLPALLNALLEMRAGGGDDVAVVFTSDHLIKEPGPLIGSIERIVKTGLAGRHIFTFGVRPARPDTGFGYIKPGRALGGGAFAAEAFVEKPDAGAARRYVAGGYYWNSGMFLFGTALFMEEARRHAPDACAAMEAADVAGRFAASPNVSIDSGVMERSARVAVLPLESDWDDLGSFAAFYDAFAERVDASGNVTFGGDVMIDAKNNLVYAQQDKAVALIGVRDLVVVDSGDALLICRSDKVQDVRGVVDTLRERGDARADYPQGDAG